MTLDTHWNCPSCGQIYHLDEPSCPVCRITRENRGVIGKASVERSIEKPPQDVEVHLPYVIKEASFNLPTADGKTVWSSGCLAVGETGLFLVSGKDGLDPLEVAERRPTAAEAVGPTSLFLPATDVLRVVHERLIGFWIETAGGKIPLRLPKGSWEDLDALCDHLGIRHT